jgi:hypothetical protein
VIKINKHILPGISGCMACRIIKVDRLQAPLGPGGPNIEPHPKVLCPDRDLSVHDNYLKAKRGLSSNY